MKSMNLKKKLSQEWITWIKTNIQRGAKFQDIVSQMLHNEFDPAYAMTAVQIIQDELNGEYIYETPRFHHKDGYIQTSERCIPIKIWMEKPRIAILDDVLSSEECDQLIMLSQNRLRRSKTLDYISGESVTGDFRTSDGTIFKRGENDLIKQLELRFSEIMNLPLDNGEGLQILHYKVGAEFKPHYDYFVPNHEGKSPILEKNRQRVSTLVVYLNDVEEGGTTTFPTIGLTVFPKKGSAVYFEYCNSLGQLDPLTLHAGTPVLKGEKWVVTQWMRQ